MSIECIAFNYAGCRSLLFSSLYEVESDTDELVLLSATDGTERVTRDCHSGMESAFDLATDPAALTPLPVNDSDAARTLSQGLDGYLSVATGDGPAISCPKATE